MGHSNGLMLPLHEVFVGTPRLQAPSYRLRAIGCWT